jgi:hypothetical protein
MEKLKLLSLISILFSSSSFASEDLSLPQITSDHIKTSELKQEQMIEELLGYDLESLDSIEENQRGLSGGQLLSYLINLVNQRVFPSHLRDFDPSILNENSDKEVFLNYKGIDGGCYQFRLFHKHVDEFIKDSVWSSSILTIPAKRNSSIEKGASVVLAPSLQGATMFIEGGLWNQLCRKSVASLVPESIYKKKWFGRWDKIPFDPSPVVTDVLDFSIYERSISRYKRLLEKNLNFLRDFDSLKMASGQFLKDLSVMNLIPERVGYWGSSLGAIVGSLIVGENTEIKGAVFTVGGGNLPYVISVSGISIFENTRERQMAILGLEDAKAYEAFLSQYLTTDPLNYVSSTDSKRVYMIIAEEDTSVPTKAQFELYEQFGRPSRSLIPAGHVLTLIYTAWIGRRSTDRALDFLVDKLSD